MEIKVEHKLNQN